MMDGVMHARTPAVIQSIAADHSHVRSINAWFRLMALSPWWNQKPRLQHKYSIQSQFVEFEGLQPKALGRFRSVLLIGRLRILQCLGCVDQSEWSRNIWSYNPLRRHFVPWEVEYHRSLCSRRRPQLFQHADGKAKYDIIRCPSA